MLTDILVGIQYDIYIEYSDTNYVANEGSKLVFQCDPFDVGET